MSGGRNRSPGSFTACPADRCSSGTGPRRPAQSPENGLTDVHRYLAITLAGQEVTIDITFPGDQAWDGRRSMNLACGDGHDFPAGEDPDAEKAALEASRCDPQVREPFIASLALASSLAGSIGRTLCVGTVCRVQRAGSCVCDCMIEDAGVMPPM